jgi:hypothetical protein
MALPAERRSSGFARHRAAVSNTSSRSARQRATTASEVGKTRSTRTCRLLFALAALVVATEIAISLRLAPLNISEATYFLTLPDKPKMRGTSGQKQQPPKPSLTDEPETTGIETTGISSRQNQHVVFFGDSIQRYSYLEWVDQEYYARGSDDSFAPPKLIHEKRHANWTEFFQYSTRHFDGHMLCDCQRSEVFDLRTEVENRYYSSPSNNFSATYLQGYGDNQAHGRFPPHEVHQAQVTSPESGLPSFKWTSMGKDWGKLLLNQVAQLQPRPTAIVLNAGLWPNGDIARNMGQILQAARTVVGSQGRVIWRATVKRQTETSALQSEADKAAQEWTYRLPGIIYQPFPQLNLTEKDYFDKNHFSEPHVYRDWNVDLTRALEVSPKKHRVFVLVGAVRTLRTTEESIVMNLIRPLCPPSMCVAHLVMHFSYTDNRPSVGSNDPWGSQFWTQIKTPERIHFSSETTCRMDFYNCIQCQATILVPRRSSTRWT